MEKSNSPFDDFCSSMQEFNATVVAAVEDMQQRLREMTRPLADYVAKMRVFQFLEQEYSPRYVTTEYNGEFITAFCMKVPQIEQKEIDGEIYYYVNAVPRGSLRAETYQAKIINILVDQFNKNAGWVPHKTFMNACGWTEQEYFRNDTNPGRMVHLLTPIKKLLGVEIKFDLNRGVRIIEE